MMTALKFGLLHYKIKEHVNLSLEEKHSHVVTSQGGSFDMGQIILATC